MCKIWEKPLQPELTTEDFLNFFKKSPHFRWVNVSGGEIFLRDDIENIFEIIIKNSKHLFLLDFPTNGTYPEKIFQVVKNILKIYEENLVVTVSIDGDKTLHNFIRGSEESWDLCIDTIKKLKTIKNKNFKVLPGITLTKDNITKLNNIVSSIKNEFPDIALKDIHINIAHYSEHYYSNIPTPNEEEKEKTVFYSQLPPLLKNFLKEKFSNIFILNPIDILEREYLATASQYFEENKLPYRCAALSASVFIDPYGTIYPCSIYNKRIGNIREYNFDINKIWNSKFTKELRHQIYRGECPGCWTPCEAYQTILANLPKLFSRYLKPNKKIFAGIPLEKD